MISDRFFYSEFASFCRAQLEFSFFLFLSKTPWRWEVKSREFQLVPLTIDSESKSRKYWPRWSTTRVSHWFFCNEFEGAQEQAPTQVPNYDKFVDAQLHYGPLWQCSEPTCTWTVAAWRLHSPFSLGITVVFSLQADASQMACCRIDCKVALNRSVALSFAHLLCAGLFITWTTLATPPTLPTLHFCTLYRRT